MKIVIADQAHCAVRMADRFEALIKARPAPVLGLATGSTPLPLYEEFVRRCKAGALSFRTVTTFNLDEYAGLCGTHPQSYRYFMDKNLFTQVDIDTNSTHVPGGDIVDADAAQAYDAAIEAAGGIDLQLLGIGANGHIGFNEPGTPFESRTHLQALTPETRQANSRFFESLEEVPTHAVTMGIRSVMNARAIVLAAFGAGKAAAVRDTVLGPVTPLVPASVLQLHPDVTLFIDAAAATLLPADVVK